MKKLSIMFLLVIFLSGACSCSESLKFTNENVSRSTEITEGEQRGKEIVPIVLFYTSRVEDTGFASKGNHKDIDVEMESDKRLADMTTNIIGVNIFDIAGFGLGLESSLDVEAQVEQNNGKYYDLVAKEKNPNI